MTPEQKEKLFVIVDAIKTDVDKLTTNFDKLSSDALKIQRQIQQLPASDSMGGTTSV